MYKVGQILKIGRALTGKVLITPKGKLGQGKYVLRVQESDLPDAHKPQWNFTEAELTTLN